jgi:neurofibromin 1
VVESEPVVRQAVAALVQLSKLRLDAVAQSLVHVLDGLLKVGQFQDGSDSQGTASTLASTPLDVVQSQLFILITLSSCLTQHWQAHAQAAAARNPGATFSTPELWTEPPPLDEALAKHILSLMNALSTQASSAPSGSRKSNSEQIAFAKHMVQQSYGTKPSSSQSVFGSERIPDTLPSATTRTRHVLAQIIFYVSASNWSFLLSRIRTRVQYLGTQGASATDDTSDLGDLRLLEWANMDRARLGQVLQGGLQI